MTGVLVFFTERLRSIRAGRFFLGFAVWIASVLSAAPALATQTHGEPEGLVVHQMAHILFALSMGTLAYWLGARGLTVRRGWRLIRYAAVLLIVWNLDAFVAHLLDEQTGFLTVQQIDPRHLFLAPQPGLEVLAPLYYLVKLDHLWCVPALIFLFLGLRCLADESEAGGAPPEAS